MTDFEAFRIEIDAQLAECRRLLARLDGADGIGAAGVRAPVDRTPPSPQRDVTHAEPAPRYRFDVVGTHGGKVTLEQKR
jgi:hypothetical protein